VSAKPDPLLEVRNLHTVFGSGVGSVTAVDDVTFSLVPGESVGIIGESGSGKSVTAFSIMGLLRPPGRVVGGSVIFENEDLLKKPDREMRRLRGRGISMILQDPMTALNPVFKVGAQIEEAVRLSAPNGRMGKLEAKERTLELLKMVRIPEPSTRANQYPHQMSGGMRQRVVSAIALAGSPRLLVADEPTTSLDVTTQLQFLDLIKDLRVKLGFALIFISHDLGVIRRVADQVAVMYAGRIVEHGHVDDVFARPAHPYTRALMGSSPDIAKRERVLLSIKGQPPDPRMWPVGCRFAPRCENVMARCHEEYPPVVTLDNDQDLAAHAASCWLYDSESGGASKA
jgi:oligopeptide/dipeptide ABC transporter ATP-binding protein